MKMTKQILIYTVLAGLFLVPFIPFIVLPATFFPFITGKGFVFRILVEILFGLYVILATVAPEYRPKNSWITKSVGVFALAILIADLFGANVYKSLWSNYERMEGFVLIAHLVLFYFVSSSLFRTVAKWKTFFDVSIVASVAMSIYGLMQLAGKVTINQGGVRLDATFGNASYLAIYLVFHIFLCIYYFIGATRARWQKIVYALIAVFEAIILYFTATRGAILGLIGGLILAGILMLWKEKENKKIRTAGMQILGGITVVIIVFFAVRNTSFVQKSPVLSRFATLSKSELQTQGRYFIWPMAIKGVIERPLFGWGQENFNFVFNKYYDPRLYGQEQWFDRTHDIFLDWLIAGGLIGFLAYASMYVAMLYYVWRKKSTMTVLQKSIFTGMIAAYVFHNAFVFDNLISYILFFSLLAFVHTMSVEDTEPHGKFLTHHVSDVVTQYAVMPVALILTICAVYFVNVPALLANYTLISAITPQQQGGVDKNLNLFKQVFAYNSFGSSEAVEQLTQVTEQIIGTTQIPDTMKKEFFDLANLELVKKITDTPHDARYLVFAGTFLNHASHYDDAIPYLTRAVAESPAKQTIYFELGTSYLGKKDYTDALEIFKKAYDIEPSAPESQIIYAVGAIYAKNAYVLKELSTKISSDTIMSDNRFLKAYADIGDFQTVIAILQIRIQKDPTNLQYQLSLASAYATSGQKQKAVDVLNQMIKEDPAFGTQGQVYIKQIQNS